MAATERNQCLDQVKCCYNMWNPRHRPWFRFQNWPMYCPGLAKCARFDVLVSGGAGRGARCPARRHGGGGSTRTYHSLFPQFGKLQILRLSVFVIHFYNNFSEDNFELYNFQEANFLIRTLHNFLSQFLTLSVWDMTVHSMFVKLSNEAFNILLGFTSFENGKLGKEQCICRIMSLWKFIQHGS